MIKLRLEGKLQDIKDKLLIIEKCFIILNKSKYYKNRNSEYYRLYIDIE